MRHDWLQQLCLMNILVLEQNYANDVRTAAAFTLLQEEKMRSHFSG